MIRTFFVYSLVAMWGLTTLPTVGRAQPVIGQKTRFRFAQMHLGLDGQYIPRFKAGI
jgi:hypothetical protein